MVLPTELVIVEVVCVVSLVSFSTHTHTHTHIIGAVAAISQHWVSGGGRSCVVCGTFSYSNYYSNQWREEPVLSPQESPQELYPVRPSVQISLIKSGIIISEVCGGISLALRSLAGEWKCVCVYGSSL